MAPHLSKRPPPTYSDIAGAEAEKIAVRISWHYREVVNDLVAVIELCQDVGSAISAPLEKAIDKLVRTCTSAVEDLCCLDIKALTKAKKPLVETFPMILVGQIIFLLYVSFTFCYLPAAGLELTAPKSILFHALVGMSVVSYLKGVMTDPGGIPSTPKWTTQGQPPSDLHERKRDGTGYRWCKKENKYKPDRAHFCKIIGRNVRRMDHSCPWLANTVGFQNHKFFFLFLLYSNAVFGLTGYSIFHLLSATTIPAGNTFFLLETEALVTFLAGILGPFFLFHLWLLSKNLTTIEFCEQKSSGEEHFNSHYDLGVYRNIQSVLGENPLLWLIPVGHPPGDGLSWPRRTKVILHRNDADKDPESAVPAPGAQDSETTLPSTGTEESEEEQSIPVRGKHCTPASCHETAVAAGHIVDQKLMEFLFCIGAPWETPAEFKEDLQEGCAGIIETPGDAFMYFATGGCLGRQTGWKEGSLLHSWSNSRDRSRSGGSSDTGSDSVRGGVDSSSPQESGVDSGSPPESGSDFLEEQFMEECDTRPVLPQFQGQGSNTYQDTF